MSSAFFELIPVLFFFVAYKCWNIYAATLVIMISLVVQILLLKLSHKNVKISQWISLTVVLILGAITLLLRNEIFIKWKPTIVYSGFAMVSLGYRWLCGKYVIQELIGDKIALPDREWKILNCSWTIFFILMSSLNLVVVLFCSTNTWVNFKVFGIFGGTLLFGLLQALCLARCLK